MSTFHHSKINPLLPIANLNHFTNFETQSTFIKQSKSNKKHIT
ncbi:hypothetical protein ABID99_001455 [Mucilaginibacter sp. OAE612]